MPRKDGSTLAPVRQAELLGLLPDGRQKAAQRATEASWAAVGVDTSMTACSVVAVGYDAMTGKLTGPTWSELRWMPDDDYFKRLGEAAKGHNIVLDCLRELWVIHLDKVYIACEEPFFYGAAKRSEGSWLKQQAEIAGSFKGSLVRYGFLNIYEINNSQWHSTLRKEGVQFQKAARGSDAKTKASVRHANKFVVKEWAIKAFGLPELPDLVKSKTGAKIPRPESGFGAKAKPEQPSDVYDAAACCAWMLDEIEEGRV